MQINVTLDQSVGSLPTGFVSAVNYVVNYFDTLFTNNCTINICVGYGEVDGQPLGSNALGSSITNYFGASYASLKSALVAENAPGSSTLPSTSPLAGSPVLSQAEAKAMGLTSTTSIDGYVGFSNTVAWDYTTAAPSAGQFYLIGTIEHEITEVMGRQSLINYQPNLYGLMDLYRYSAPGVRSVAPGGSGSTAYFSIDNGTTNLATWNNNPGNGDLGDWYPSGPAAGGRDANNDYSSSGVINTFSATDITNMQAIGWTVASGAAAPTIASFSPDRGVVGDGITNANVLTLTGLATASSTVNVYDGATLLGTAVADASGNWSLTTGTLSNGNHSFTATDTVSGTTSAASAALSVTVDTIAPVAPSITSFSPDSGVVGDHITNVNTLTLTGTAEANSTVKVYDGATLLGSATANGSGAWSYTTAALSNGTHNLTATATDAAGNTGVASSVAAITVNTPIPTAPAIASFSNDSGTAGDGITNDNTLTLIGAAIANSTINLYDGATLLGSALASGSGAWTYTTAALADGSHSLTATDTVAGLTSAASSTLAVTIDTTAPVVPAIASFSTDSGTVGDHITNDNTPMLTGTAEANSTVHIYDGATLLGSATANGSGAWTYTTAALTDGAHNLTITDSDAAGNTSAASTALNLTIDTIAPTAASITSDAIVNTNEIALTGTAEANSIIKLYDGATLLGNATTNGSGAWSFTTGTLSNATHSVTAMATDAAGNTGAVSSALDVTVDTSQTAIAVTTDSYMLGLRGTALLAGSSEANSSISIYDNNTGTMLGHTTASSTGVWSTLMGNLSNTVHSLTLMASDSAGHTGSANVVYGTTGNDTITAGAANETLFGYGGNDTFVFSANIGKDTIADFQATNDVLQISHNVFASFADVLAHAAQVGSDVTVTIDPHDSVTLHNTTLTHLTTNNFHLV